MTEKEITVPELVLAAEERIRAYIRQTILEPASFYNDSSGAQGIRFWRCIPSKQMM